MNHPISHDKEPIRLFKSDFLEFFTHIHPIVVVIIWLPVAVWFLYRPVTLIPATGGSWLNIPVGFLAGLFVWTFAEYTMHRFVFHFHPRTPLQERISFLFHGVHHAQPQCKTRLVMPPAVSIPFGLFIYGLSYLVWALLLNAAQFLDPFMSGMAIGYLGYDLTHYATHHFPMRAGVLKYLKRHHLKHHYKTPSMRFGVSSSVWDRVFGTLPND